MNPKNMVTPGVSVNRTRPRSCTGKLALLNTKKRVNGAEYNHTETCRVETGYVNCTGVQKGQDDCVSSASQMNIVR